MVFLKANDGLTIGVRDLYEGPTCKMLKEGTTTGNARTQGLRHWALWKQKGP